ncbi:hypothetical protein G6F24_018633 [Rhizopus arrhizus]|nr:hypothetical protein G6F24_018633 [Rhizopus arrhizus]
MLESRLTQADVAKGFILDGYPRNVAQANAMDGLLAKIGQPLDAVVQLDVATELLVERIAGRAKEQGRLQRPDRPGGRLLRRPWHPGPRRRRR